MAQWTESTASGIRPYRTPFGMTPSRRFPEAESSTFHAGNIVEPGGTTSAHRVAIASSLSTSVLGVVADPASSNQDESLNVYMAYPNIEFKGWVKEVIASTMVGQFRSFAYDSSQGIHYIAVNSTAGDNRVQITEIGSTTEGIEAQLAGIGDTNGYVAFHFLAEFTAFGKST